MKEIVSISEQQRRMHKNFFDHCSDAIEQGYYLEAILMEYAAIESRMEVLLGVLGLPCNKFESDSIRKSIQLSHRIKCADRLRKTSKVFENTKLSRNFFQNLLSWTNQRNEYIHGLYKNEIKYTQRIKNAKKFSKDGYKYCNQLYGEVNRIKRQLKKINYLYEDAVCFSKDCNLYKN